MIEKEYLIEGMHCGACGKRVASLLKQIDGVIEVNVDISSKITNVSFSNSVLDESVVNAVTDLGYHARLINQ